MLKSSAFCDSVQLSTGRLVIAGVTSGVGKTTISLAIMHGLRKSGFKVQPFKVGPDFIDPSYHSVVCGRSSHNLDPWLMRESGVRETFDESVDGSDIAIIEGVMGIYDGVSGRNDYASTAHVARLLRAPVILVIDASKAARSLAAVAYGIIKFDPRLKIAGIIINNVGSDKHESFIREAFAQKIRTPIVGLVRREASIRLEERHLGLVPAVEVSRGKRFDISRIASRVADQLDLGSIRAIAKQSSRGPKKAGNARRNNRQGVTKIAVALDQSFNFYYPENLELLRRNGAVLSFFSPVTDKRPPSDIDGMMIGGGFPEVLADKLEENRQMADVISRQVNDGMPLYAECGGLMYLTRSIRGYGSDGRGFRMAGVIDADTVMTKKLTLNYTLAESAPSAIGAGRLRGHEFHYSALENVSNDSRFAYTMLKGKGATGLKDGFLAQNCLASYMHLHFAGKPSAARQFVKFCASYSRR